MRAVPTDHLTSPNSIADSGTSIFCPGEPAPFLGRVPHPSLGPLRHRRRGARPASPDPRGRVRREPSPLPLPGARAAQAGHRGVDQRLSTRPRASCSEGFISSCLKMLAKLRVEVVNPHPLGETRPSETLTSFIISLLFILDRAPFRV